MPHASGPSTATFDAPAYTPAPIRSATHLPALDGLRGLAVAIVIVGHIILALPEVAPRAPLLQRAIRSIGSFGWTGVDLFFVLSGFLITGILVDAKGSAHYFRNFYARRSLRIFPLYFGFCIAVFVVLPLAWSSPPPEFEALQRDQVWYWTYLSNVLAAFGGSREGLPRMGHFWSLAIEEQFYLLWPLFVYRLSTTTLRTVCVVGIALALLIRTAFQLGGYNLAAYALMPSRMDALLLGAFVALVVRTPGGLDRLVRVASRVLPAAGVTIAALYLTWMRFHYTNPAIITVGVLVMATFYAALLVHVLNAPSGSAAHRAFMARPMRWLGKYSYGLYVFHWPLFDVVKKAGIRVTADASGSSLATWAVLSVAVVTTAVGTAWASWHLYEKRWLRLKDRFPMESTPSPMTRGAAPRPA